MQRKTPWIGGLFAITLAMQASATEVYTWTDEQGVTHFGDRAPSAHDAEQVAVAEPNLIDAYPVDNAAGPTVSAPTAPGGRPPRVSGSRSGEREHRRAEKCHKARQQLRLIRAKRRAGYRASKERALDARQARYRADERFYCE